MYMHVCTCSAHYTPVLPVLFLIGGRHLFQDEKKLWHLGSTIFTDAPVRKLWHLEKQYSQDATVCELLMNSEF